MTKQMEMFAAPKAEKVEEKPTPKFTYNGVAVFYFGGQYVAPCFGDRAYGNTKRQIQSEIRRMGAKWAVKFKKENGI